MRRLLRSDFVRDGAIVAIATTLVSASNYLFNAVATRLLGAVNFGALASIAAVILLATVPATILSMTFAKAAAEVRGNSPLTKGTHRLAHRVALPLAILTLAAGALFARPLAEFLRLDDSWAVIVASLAVAAAFPTAAARGVVQGEQRFRLLAISFLGEAAAKFAVGIALALTFGARGAIAGYAAGGIVGGLIAEIGLLDARRGAAVMPHLERLVKSTLGITGSTFATSALAFVDVVLVKHYFDPLVAGRYAALALVGRVIFFAVGFLPTILLPKAASGEPGSMRRVLVPALATLAAVDAVLLPLVAIFPAAAMRVVSGSAYAAMAPYAAVYAIANSLLAATGLVAAYRIGVHRFAYVPWLLACGVLEIAGIAFVHATLWQVVAVVLVCDALALVVTLVGAGPDRVRLSIGEEAIAC